MIPANYSYISFPFLGLELNPPRVLELGPLTVHYYGAIIAVGLMLGMLYCLRRGKEFGLEENDILDGFLWITPLAIVCARIYYCIFSWDEYAANPISVLYIWNGGIAIYGSVIGAILGMAIFAKVKKVKLTSVLDLVLMAFLIGQFIGRWGNFMNREAFGAATDSYFRMGLFNTKTNAWEYTGRNSPPNSQHIGEPENRLSSIFHLARASLNVLMTASNNPRGKTRKFSPSIPRLITRESPYTGRLIHSASLKRGFTNAASRKSRPRRTGGKSS